jgi:hypothetical protein
MKATVMNDTELLNRVEELRIEACHISSGGWSVGVCDNDTGMTPWLANGKTLREALHAGVVVLEKEKLS